MLEATFWCSVGGRSDSIREPRAPARPEILPAVWAPLRIVTQHLNRIHL